MDMEKQEALELAEVNEVAERAKAIATLIIVCVANVANVCGFAVDADPWVNAVLSVISVLAIAYTWWKNQNITSEAMQAQALLDLLKSEKKAAKHAAMKED